MIEHVLKRTELQLKQAQSPMELAIICPAKALDPEVDHPQVSESNSHQEPSRIFQSRDVAFMDVNMDVEAPALLIRKKYLDLKLTVVEGDRLLGKLEVCNQRHPTLIVLLVPEYNLNRTAAPTGYRRSLHACVALPAERIKLSDWEGLPASIFGKSLKGGSTNGGETLLIKSPPKLDGFELPVSHQDSGRVLRQNHLHFSQ